MEKENLFVAAKGETFAMALTDMMGDPGDIEQGEVRVALGVDNSVRVFESFDVRETFLVALKCWNDGCNAEVGEYWLAEKLRGEEMSGEEMPVFSLKISEDLVVTEADGGYVFEDSLGMEYDYDEVVKILKEVADYFGE